MTFDTNEPLLRDATTRKGEFRELARDIVWKDRSHKKFGRSVDTGGAIARAMEAAYKLGLSHGSTPQKAASHPGEVEPTQGKSYTSWNTIPARARSAFESIMRYDWVVILALDAEPWKSQPDRWACYWDAGESKSEADRFSLASTYSLSTLQPLIRMGLMEEKRIAEKAILLQTDLGEATWKAAIDAGHVREDFSR